MICTSGGNGMGSVPAAGRAGAQASTATSRPRPDRRGQARCLARAILEPVLRLDEDREARPRIVAGQAAPGRDRSSPAPKRSCTTTAQLQGAVEVVDARRDVRRARSLPTSGRGSPAARGRDPRRVRLGERMTYLPAGKVPYRRPRCVGIAGQRGGRSGRPRRAGGNRRARPSGCPRTVREASRSRPRASMRSRLRKTGGGVPTGANPCVSGAIASRSHVR